MIKDGFFSLDDVNAMSDDELRIRLLLATGETLRDGISVEDALIRLNEIPWFVAPYYDKPPCLIDINVPDYFNSMSAVMEVEDSLDLEQKAIYVDNLRRVLGNDKDEDGPIEHLNHWGLFDLLSAKATPRIKALIMTLKNNIAND